MRLHTYISEDALNLIAVFGVPGVDKKCPLPDSAQPRSLRLRISALYWCCGSPWKQNLLSKRRFSTVLLRYVTRSCLEAKKKAPLAGLLKTAFSSLDFVSAGKSQTGKSEAEQREARRLWHWGCCIPCLTVVKGIAQ